MNWGRIIGFAFAIESFGCAIGYAVIGDWRRALYFMFGGAITLTVVY